MSNQLPMQNMAQAQFVNAQQAAANQIWINTGSATTASAIYSLNSPILTTVGGGTAAIVRSLMKVAIGETADIELPDGARLQVSADGSYRIEDKDAKITYRANRVREFNRFLNASDLLVKFIGYLNSLHLNQKEALALPIDLFIAWLIIEAAKADDEEPQQEEIAKLDTLMRQHVRIDPPVPALALPAPMPRCLCGRFMARQRKSIGLLFCSGAHMDRYEKKLLIQEGT